MALNGVAVSTERHTLAQHEELLKHLDRASLEDLIEIKLERILKDLPLNNVDNLHELIMPRLERPLLRMIMGRTQGNQLKAAAALGMNRNTLRKKLNLLKIK